MLIAVPLLTFSKCENSPNVHQLVNGEARGVIFFHRKERSIDTRYNVVSVHTQTLSHA